MGHGVGAPTHPNIVKECQQCLFIQNKKLQQDFIFTQSTDLTGRPPPLFSDHLVVPVEDSSAYEKHFYIQQIRPLPCTIEELSPFIEFDER